MRRGRHEREGFTLIELLAVIAIIAILSGLILGGIGRVRIAAQRAQAMADMNALSTGIGHFCTKYNVHYIPAGFSLEQNYTDAGSNASDAAYLKRVFPNIQLNATGAVTDRSMSQNQTLMFFLMGGDVTGYTGFSSNRSAPFTPGGTRVGPFTDIPASKINANGEMIDPWGTPYAYFTATNGNDYPSSPFTANGTSVYPYSEGGRYVQQKSFQIISAGPDRRFGPGGDYRGTNAGSYAAGQAGGDDLTSFAQAGSVQQ